MSNPSLFQCLFYLRLMLWKPSVVGVLINCVDLSMIMTAVILFIELFLWPVFPLFPSFEDYGVLNLFNFFNLKAPDFTCWLQIKWWSMVDVSFHLVFWPYCKYNQVFSVFFLILKTINFGNMFGRKYIWTITQPTYDKKITWMVEA